MDLISNKITNIMFGCALNKAFCMSEKKTFVKKDMVNVFFVNLHIDD